MAKSAKGRVPVRQPKRSYAKLLATLRSKSFCRPPTTDAKAFTVFLCAVRDSVTDRKALRLPGVISTFWRALVLNAGDEEKAWACHR